MKEGQKRGGRACRDDACPPTTTSTGYFDTQDGKAEVFSKAPDGEKGAALGHRCVVGMSLCRLSTICRTETYCVSQSSSVSSASTKRPSPARCECVCECRSDVCSGGKRRTRRERGDAPSDPGQMSVSQLEVPSSLIFSMFSPLSQCRWKCHVDLQDLWTKLLLSYTRLDGTH